jgi:hypothetical protein
MADTYEIFTTSDTFVVPGSGAVNVYVEAWGPGGGGSGGGGGGAPTGGATPGGGGGGGPGASGQYVGRVMPCTGGETLTITVPAGGAAGSGGSGGANAVGNDGTDGSDASDTVVAGAVTTITAKGGRGTIIPASDGTSRGKGGTGTTAGAAGGNPTVPAAVAINGSGIHGAVVGLTALISGRAAATNANCGGGGQGGAPVPCFGFWSMTTAAAVNPSGTTGGTGATCSFFDQSGLLGGSVTGLQGGAGGNGNGTNHGAQGTDTSTRIGVGGAGGGGGGGNVAGGTAGNGANGRAGGPGLVIIYYTS